MLPFHQRAGWLAVAALLVTGCAAGVGRLSADSPRERYRNYAGTPVERITAFDVNGWTALSRNELVLWTGVNEAWLVTVWDSCRDLEYAQRIRVERTGASITRLDRIGVGRDRCPISEIRPIDVRQMRADRSAERATERAAAAPPPP